MRFTTFGFALFFVLLYVLYWSLRGRARLIVLLVSSVFFYAFWSVPFLLHFVILILLNYYFVQRLRARPKGSEPQDVSQKITLATILSIDVANLFFFKYFYFFLRVMVDSTGIAAFQPDVVNVMLHDRLGVDSIALPLGISFYTFQIVAYVVDVYRQQVRENHSLFEFSLYSLLFLGLTAGPIMRHSDFFHQLGTIRPDQQKAIRGITLLLMGLAKKILIADNMAQLIRPVYADPARYDGFSCAMAGVGYAVQVFSDFSGYTDLARGLALLLGLELPENFTGPYLSRSVSEFWRRWHITFSSWLRDYIYIPLGGSRATPVRTSLNLLITFTIGGIWHGANYTFLVWGFSAGVFLALERLVDRFTPLPSLLERLRRNRVPRFLTNAAGVAYAFTAFLFGTLFFNAPDLGRAMTMLHRILWLEKGLHPNPLPHLGMLAVVFMLNWIQFRDYRPQISPGRAYGLLAAAGLLLMLLLGVYAPGGQSFIYYNF